MSCEVIWGVIDGERRDTPAAGARQPGLPGILTSMSVSACLGPAPWTTVNHNI
jgi:hypothetical protein